ncbi:ribosome-binding factor A [Patescibacteria group bacterium]|nr:ribosome-binding factor A [Patescibacteria group bacterium]
MSRITQVNELLKNNLSYIITREIEIGDALLTITYVDTSPDLQNAKVGISVLPKNNTGTVLHKLKNSTVQIVQKLNKITKIRKMPKLNWVVDDTENRLADMEESFLEIKSERQRTR